jgi:hypothetical protein
LPLFFFKNSFNCAAVIRARGITRTGTGGMCERGETGASGACGTHWILHCATGMSSAASVQFVSVLWPGHDYTKRWARQAVPIALCLLTMCVRLNIRYYRSVCAAQRKFVRCSVSRREGWWSRSFPHTEWDLLRLLVSV